MNIIQKIAHPILRFLIRLFHYAPPEENWEEEYPGERIEEEFETRNPNPESDLEEEEKRMIHGVVELGETQVKEIMLPRPDMICAEENSGLEEFRELVKKYGHSRIPIYKENIDHITGIVYVKDLYIHAHDPEKVSRLSQLARKAHFVPESKRVDELLKEFKRDKNHVAIVVDEYGGTAGLVTMEDILEEIVGEIQDEYDRELPPIQPLDDKTFRVDGKVSIKDLNETLGTEIEEKGFETVGGLIYDLVGGVPEQGRMIPYRSGETALELVVEKLQGQRIKSIKIIITAVPPTEKESGDILSPKPSENE
jgi:CBS domain containing-hemolysin-like protein